MGLHVGGCTTHGTVLWTESITALYQYACAARLCSWRQFLAYSRSGHRIGRSGWWRLALELDPFCSPSSPSSSAGVFAQLAACCVVSADCHSQMETSATMVRATSSMCV